MIKLLEARYVGHHRIELTFSDGRRGVFDVDAYLTTRQGPLLEPLYDERYLQRFLSMPGPCAGLMALNCLQPVCMKSASWKSPHEHPAQRVACGWSGRATLTPPTGATTKAPENRELSLLRSPSPTDIRHAYLSVLFGIEARKVSTSCQRTNPLPELM